MEIRIRVTGKEDIPTKQWREILLEIYYSDVLPRAGERMTLSHDGLRGAGEYWKNLPEDPGEVYCDVVQVVHLRDCIPTIHEVWVTSDYLPFSEIADQFGGPECDEPSA